jgi:hypothetical protein
VEFETMTTTAIRRGAGPLAPALASAALLLAALALAGCASPELGARHRDLEKSFLAGAPASARSDDDDPFARAPQLERETFPSRAGSRSRRSADRSSNPFRRA